MEAGEGIEPPTLSRPGYEPGRANQYPRPRNKILPAGIDPTWRNAQGLQSCQPP